MRLLAFLLLSAVRLLQYLLQHLLLLPQHLDNLPLPFQTVLEVALLLIAGALLRGLLPRPAHLQNAFLIVLDDRVLLLYLRLVVCLQLHLVLLEPQHLGRPLLSRLLHPLRLLPRLCQFLPKQLGLLLQPLVLSRQRQKFRLPLETFLPFVVDGVGVVSWGVGFAGAVGVACVEEGGKLVYFLLEFQFLLPGVLLEFDLSLQQCLLVAHVAHAFDEPFEGALQLRQRLVLLAQNIDYFGAIFLIDLPLQQLVPLLLQLHSIVQLLVLVPHFLPHVLQQIPALLARLTQIDSPLPALLPLLGLLPAIPGLSLIILQFHYPPLQKLYLLQMQYLRLPPKLPQLILDLREEMDRPEQRLRLRVGLVQLVLLQIQQPGQPVLLIDQVGVQLPEFAQLAELLLVRGHRVGLVALVDLPALVLDPVDPAGGTLMLLGVPGQGVRLLPLLPQILQFLELLDVLLLGVVAGKVEDGVLQLDDALRHAFALIVLLVQLADGGLVDAFEFPLGLLLVPLHLFPQPRLLSLRSLCPRPQLLCLRVKLIRLRSQRMRMLPCEHQFSLRLCQQLLSSVGE